MGDGMRTGDLPVDSNNVVRTPVKVPEFDKHLKKPAGHIVRSVVEITMKAIVRKPLFLFCKGGFRIK